MSCQVLHLLCKVLPRHLNSVTCGGWKIAYWHFLLAFHSDVCTMSLLLTCSFLSSPRRPSTSLVTPPACLSPLHTTPHYPLTSSAKVICVKRPAIVREIPHFGLIPAFPHFFQIVPHFWLYFEVTKIAENSNTFSCTETLCSKKVYENVSDSVT